MKSPIITMAAVTGKPSKQQIFNWLTNLNENGFGDIAIYPRSGCEIEYLSNEWFDMCGIIIDKCAELQMDVYIYDDFNWPSGDANGKVTVNPDYRLKNIAIKGDNAGTVGCHSVLDNTIFGEKYFPNLLNKSSVEYFIELTHEQYYKHFHKYFGNVIKGFFTDEPAVGYGCEISTIPYYDGMENDYNSAFNRDFMTDLKAEYPDFTKNAFEIIAKQFKYSFVDTIADWCASHNVLMAGHLMGDNSPYLSTLHSGNLLYNLKGFSLPGIDDIDTDFSYFTLFSVLGAVEYAAGENGAMAELFALGPCDLSFAKRKAMIYLTACFKIDHYFTAISAMDFRGNAFISDYFDPLTNSQPCFAGMKLLAEEAKIAAKIAKKAYKPQVFIKYPWENCAKNYGDTSNVSKVHSLTRRLSMCNVAWEFCEEASNENTVVFDDNFNYVFKGQTYTTVESILPLFGAETPNGIFQRRFTDGSTVAINTTADVKSFTLNGDEITLDGYGVYYSENPPKVYNGERTPVTEPFEVSFKNDNIIRAMFINEQTDSKLTLTDDCTVTFTVRNGVSAYLDGEKLIADNTAVDVLPEGFAPLYCASKPMKLKKGTYTLSSEDDIKYLPSVMVIGDFSAENISDDICELVLLERVTHLAENSICDFGRIEFSTKVLIPDNAKAISIKGNNLLTRVFANDRALGEFIAQPMHVEIPSDLKGLEVTLKIEQSSSLAPIFGDVKYFNDHSNKTKWATVPHPTKTTFGFDAVSFILE